MPKQLVHRTVPGEVMATGWSRTDDTHFRVTAQWPRSHSFYTPVAGEYYDPLMIAETIRQAGFLVAHSEFGVPLGHQFLLWELALSVQPEQLKIHEAPAVVDVAVTIVEVKRRGNGDVTALRYEMDIMRDGLLAASGSATTTCASPGVYRRIRGAYALGGNITPLSLTAPVAPQNVGRTSPVDVVLSPIGEPNRWQLRVDTRHPVLFDHPVDHVPGMLLMEAARQSAASILGLTSILPLGITVDFRRYVELDRACVIEARLLPERLPDGRRVVLVTGHQDGDLCYTARVIVAPQG
ncbi:ScbA/BarX family gamma-butyrolactone biosynthesis protein [Streptomyces sp. NPDC101733]|uniref:ScbA/BarX family gamma-butyrolactone biosynthesis protein n=1 Tax=unclassified Streptomyces TaxID=2593676 RepID=UPI00380DC07E